MTKVLTLIIVLLLGVAAVEGYLIFSNNFTITPKNTSSPQPTSSVVEATVTPTAIPTATPDQSEILKTVIKQALVAKHGSSANELTITVSKIEGGYASGGASASAGGGMWFAAKVNGSWKLVWDGNGTISCNDIAPYPQFPTDMIPECWNETTQKIVKR